MKNKTNLREVLGLNEGFVSGFNDVKGYGFIKMADSRQVFVHYTSIISEGFKTLAVNQKVTFDLYTENDKLIAKNVKKE